MDLALDLKTLLIFFCALTLSACSREADRLFQGYAEGEYIRVAASFAGNLTSLPVQKGQQVKAGDPLFALEQENEKAERLEAFERLKRARAQLDNLRKGKRPEEIDAIQAQHEQATASLKLSEKTLQRQENLIKQGMTTRERVDEARSQFQRDRARVEELSAQVRIAKLPARSDEINAARAEVEAAEASLAQAEWKLSQKSVKSPVDGLITDRYYLLGELVPAGNPVISLLPPQNIKIRFFVSEGQLSQLKISQAVHIRCDGCGQEISGQISFISPQAEFTPPVIYSKETRAKLVYLVEATLSPEGAGKLHPGQPVDIKL